MNNLDLLIPSTPDRRTDSWIWATITQADPLRIRLDGDADPLPATPDSLFSGGEVGQRVWVQLSGHRVIVHAPSQGGGGPQVDVTPIGVVQMYMGATPPVNYLFLDGSTFDTAAYPDLYALLGTNVLPDMRDRAPVGAGGTKSLGSMGGFDNVTLTENELPYHDHYVYDHQHYFSDTTSADGYHDHQLDLTSPWDAGSLGNYVRRGSTSAYVTQTAGHAVHFAGEHTHSVSGYTDVGGSGYTSSEGGGDAFSIQNPYLAINFIIKAK